MKRTVRNVYIRFQIQTKDYIN